MKSRKIFYRFLSMFISLNLAFFSSVAFYTVPVYATSTDQDDQSWIDTANDYLTDCLLQICASSGYVLNLVTGDASSAMESFYIANYLYDKTYKEYIQEHFVPHDDGTATIDAELYQFLLDFIEANKDTSFDIHDYIYYYYPDDSAAPWYSKWSSAYPKFISQFVDYVLPSGASGFDIMKKAVSGDALIWSSSDQVHYIFDYTEYRGQYDYIFCCAREGIVESTGYQFYGYNSSSNTFTFLPYYYLLCDTSGNVTRCGISVDDTGYNYVTPDGDTFSSYDYYCLLTYQGCFFESSSHYFGSIYFPVYLSKAKFIEYTIIFQDYNKGLDYVINEDNSVTINNFYYGGGSSTDPIDYSQYLQYILSEIQAVNSSISNLDMNCDHFALESYLESMNNQLTDLYSLLSLVVSKMDANASDYSDIVDSLDSLSVKLDMINNSINNPDYSDVTNRLDSMEGTVEEMKGLISDQNQSLSDIKDTLTNMDGNISEINITIQNLSSSINDQFLSITKNGFKDVVDQLEELNDNLVALSRALVGKDAFEDALSGVKSNIPDPDDIILASVNELAELQEEALSFGGALGDIFSKLLDFQTGIDDLVQDEEYIDEVEGLLRQLLPKDPEDNEDDSFFDKVLKTIEMSLQLYANSVDEIKETSKKKFPFSIGYDIELLLLLLSAEPQTPVFKIPFEYQRLNYKTEIVIDFSMFDDAIDVIRFFLTIYYCFFLLLITPKMIGLNNEVDS